MYFKKSYWLVFIGKKKNNKQIGLIIILISCYDRIAKALKKQ